MKQAPYFWQMRDHPASLALVPVACVWSAAGRVRRAFAMHASTPIPSICVGNVTVGGAGKTPVTLALAAKLQQMGAKPATATRGYGAKVKGVVRVEPKHHTAQDVGD